MHNLDDQAAPDADAEAIIAAQPFDSEAYAMKNSCVVEMSKPPLFWSVVISCFVLVVIQFLSGCAWLTTSDVASTPTATPSLSAMATPRATASPQPTASATPTTTSGPAAVVTPTSSIHQLLLKKPSLGWLILDQTDLYWIADEEGYHIYRYPLAGDRAPAIIATSQFVNNDNSPYRHGALGVLRPIRTGDLLIYLDTKYPAVNDTWNVHMLNLVQGTDSVLLRGDNVRLTPHLAAQGDWFAWTTLERTTNTACDGDDTIVAFYNLRTHAQRELDRSCSHREWSWGDIQLNDNELVSAQWFGNNVKKYVTFNLLNDSRIVESQEEYEQHHPPTERWVVVATGRELLVSDHLIPQLLTVATVGEDEWIRDAVILGNTIVWSRIFNATQAGPHDIMLEWRTLP